MNQDELWMFKYGLLKNYYNEYGVIDFLREFKTKDGVTYDSDGYALGYWLYDQKKLNDSGELLEYRKKLLEELGVNLVKAFEREDKWMYQYSLLKAYYKEYGNTEVLYRFKTKDGITYDEDGINLGRWVHNQRRYMDSLPSERKKLLEELGFRFVISSNEYIWQQNYNLAKEYYKKHKHLNMPISFKTKDGITYDEDGKALRKWLNTQILLYKNGTLLNKRYKLLCKIGLDFEQDMLEYKWNEMYKLAVAYYNYHKDLEVPAKFKTKDGISYDNDGFNLGTWIKNQRTFYYNKQLTQERYNLLCNIGMRFNGSKRDIDWENMYKLLKAYHDKYGDLDISSKFRTKDGIHHCADGIYLKSWLLDQIKLYHEGKLTDYKIEKLVKINVSFEERKTQEEISLERWNEMYKLASIYYEQYRNLEIVRSFRTNDGITYDKDGKKLGTWISSQRFALYDGKLTSDKEKMLDSIGMIWNVRTNIDEIKEICNEHGISYEDNVDTLSHISQLELMCKIRYLNDMGISILHNGKLHEIFSMSNMNMSLIYNITLEELITKYTNNSNLKKVRRK